MLLRPVKSVLALMVIVAMTAMRRAARPTRRSCQSATRRERAGPMANWAHSVNPSGSPARIWCSGAAVDIRVPSTSTPSWPVTNFLVWLRPDQGDRLSADQETPRPR
jgi:hypothetical protein